MSLLSFADDLTQPAGRRYVEQTLGSETWLTVHSYVDAPMYDGTVFSALIPNDRVEHALKEPGWELTVGRGLPDFSVGRDGRRYESWTTGHGILPLVLVREFHIPIEGVQRVELLEEFRLFHDLAYVPRRQEYLEVSSSTPTVIARRVDGRMEVRRTAIRQFLAAKEMHLALFFHKTQMSDERVDVGPHGGSGPTRRDERSGLRAGGPSVARIDTWTVLLQVHRQAHGAALAPRCGRGETLRRGPVVRGLHRRPGRRGCTRDSLVRAGRP